MSRPRNDDYMPSKTVFLMCEKREKYVGDLGHGLLRSVYDPSRCNMWTKHLIERCDVDGTLHYRCSECGCVRVYGSFGGDPREIVVGS